MTPGDFKARVHAAGPFVGHPFTCDHPSASGVDDAPFGDTKVWRCDVCGVLYRSVRVEGSLRRIAPIEADQ